MNVTFHESEPFFSASEPSTRGEYCGKALSLPQPLASLLGNSLPFEDTHPIAGESGTGKLAINELRTYLRTEQPHQNSIEQLPCQLQSLGLDSSPPFGNDSSHVSPITADNISPIVDDTNLTVAVCKGVGMYTRHSISKFISY